MLVRCGKTLLGFDVIDNWGKELKDVNGDKSDEPFQHPNTFLLLLGHVKAYFHLPYLQIEGTAKGHAKGKLPSITEYITISRRLN